MFRIIPKEGLKVINPDTLKKVPKEGAIISKWSTYWERRKKDKDITVEDLSKTKTTPKKEGNK